MKDDDLGFAYSSLANGLRALYSRFAKLTQCPESPLEWKFLEAFAGEHFTIEGACVLVAKGFWLEPQARVGVYTTDFVMGLKFGQRSVDVAIEIDGRDFHDRDAADIERDKRRDRAFVRIGAVVLRFAGSEVMRNARGCVEEVKSLLTQWAEWAERAKGKR